MAVPRPSAFERLLAGLDAQTFAAFVADLWTARDAAAREAVSDERDQSEQSVLTVYWRSRPGLWVRVLGGRVDATDANVLVTNRDHPRLAARAAEAGAGYVGPSELRDVCLYAIDRDRCDELFRAHFGRSVADPSVADDPPARMIAAVGHLRESRSDDGPRALTVRRSVGVLVLAILLWSLAVVGLSGASLHDGTDSGSADLAAVGFGPASGGDYPRTLAAADAGRLAPLLAEHRRAVGNSSVRLTVAHSRARGDLVTTNRWERSTQTVVAGPDGRFALRVDGTIAPATIGADARPVSVRARGNASACAARGDWGATGLPTGGPCALLSGSDPDRAVARTTVRYVRRYLNGTAPAVRALDGDATGAYRVESTRPPRSFLVRPQNYSAAAVVDSQGLLTALTVSYESPRSPGTGRVSFTYRLDDEASAANDRER